MKALRIAEGTAGLPEYATATPGHQTGVGSDSGSDGYIQFLELAVHILYAVCLPSCPQVWYLLYGSCCVSEPFTGLLLCPRSRAAAEWLNPLCLCSSCDSAVWLNDFPLCPTAIMFYCKGLLMKRKSALAKGLGGSTHSQRSLLGACRREFLDRLGESGEKEGRSPQTCGAAKWQFSAGKKDLNHMFQLEYFGTASQSLCADI